MFCHKCGNKLPEGALFCQNCGEKVLIGGCDNKSTESAAITDRTPIKEESSTYSAPVNERTEQVYANEKQDKEVYENYIKPYYREQFERIASGEKPKFNWAALFLNGWIQLYHGCTGIFCKTFLPLLIALFMVEMISLVSILNFNLALLMIALILGLVVSLGIVVLSIINGFKFNQWYYQDVMSNPGKKRSRKGFWILLISEIAMVVFLTMFSYVKIVDLFFGNFTGEITDYEVTDTQTEYENVNLSKTYINEEEGISFRYPSAWIPLSEEEIASYIDNNEHEYPLVFLANEIEDLPEENTYIMISKFNVMQADIDHLFIDDEQFAATFDDGVSVKDTFFTELDSLPAREITYIDSDGIGYQSYFYAVGSTLYRIDFCWLGESSGNHQRFFDAIIDSYTITGNEGSKNDDLGESIIGGNDNELMEYKMAYAQKIQELAVDDTMQFSLIYLTGSDIPELVAEHSGYDVSVFAWVDGKIITLMDQWPYGAGGNTGYEYLPGNNIIRNYDMDYAGAVIYESYLTVNDDYEVVELLDEGLSIWYFRDINGDGMIDEDEYCDEPIYYYGDSEISEEEYAAYQVRGDFDMICGEMSTEEIMAQLESDVIGSITDDSAPSYYEPIEDYWKLSGSYSDSTDGLTLSLSIYSSQEEGEIEIGSADIYASNGQHYVGSVTPVEKNVYKIATDTGEEVLLVEEDYGDIIMLQLYVDGQYLGEYQMVEHYES